MKIKLNDIEDYLTEIFTTRDTPAKKDKPLKINIVQKEDYFAATISGNMTFVTGYGGLKMFLESLKWNPELINTIYWNNHKGNFIADTLEEKTKVINSLKIIYNE